jgi:hypothetical protein
MLDVVAEAERVGEFVNRGLTGLGAQLEDLEKMAKDVRKNREIEAGERPEKSKKDSLADSDDELDTESTTFHELRLLEALGRASDGVQKLKGFAELNHAALYKILKKHDKHFGSKEGLGQRFPALMEVTQLNDSERMTKLAETVQQLSLGSGHTEGLLHTNPEVARLCVGLGPGSASSGPGRGGATARTLELVLSFFMGCFTALFLSIGVLLALPSQSPHSYSEAYFLTPMPVFRVVFSVLLCYWCMGIVARISERWDINHMFMLKIDPRCHVTPEWFFCQRFHLDHGLDRSFRHVRRGLQVADPAHDPRR